MDKQILITYAKKLKIAIIILIAGLAVCIMLLQKLIPKVTKFSDTNKEIAKQTAAIEENTKRLETLKKSLQEKAEQKTDVVKEIFRPVDMTLSAEFAITEEFGDILKILRANSVKARSVKYNYNPSGDNFIQKAANKYNVCLLSLELIADYKHFQAFLRDLYKHEHFLDISDIEIVPYEKDKKILLIKSNIKLYSQKNGTDAVSDVQKAPEPPKETSGEPQKQKKKSKK